MSGGSGGLGEACASSPALLVSSCRFATRLFDGPEYVFVNESALPLVLDQAADRELAYEAAASGIVLLQVRVNAAGRCCRCAHPPAPFRRTTASCP